MAGMPIDKLTPIIDEGFFNAAVLRIVEGSTVEGSEAMGLVAFLAVKKQIFAHQVIPLWRSKTTGCKGRATFAGHISQREIVNDDAPAVLGGASRQRVRELKCWKFLLLLHFEAF